MSTAYKLLILLTIVCFSKACTDKPSPPPVVKVIPESPPVKVESPKVVAKPSVPAPKAKKKAKAPEPEDNQSQEYISASFSRVAREVEVPEKLLRAVCYSESHFLPRSYADGDGTGTNHAFGICQILRSTAESMGFKDPNCHGTFVYSTRTYDTCHLFGVYTNILYAAKYLKSKLDEYNGSWISAIAAYNTGSVRLCKNGVVRRAKDHSVLWTCKRGGILNQKYVDGVLKALEEGR